METASAPTFYLPAEDVQSEYLRPAAGETYCEWKGKAVYFEFDPPWGAYGRVAWSYPAPKAEFAMLAGYLAFYPLKLECYVDDERVRAQPGGFYGGWMTSDIVGPAKGARGSEGW